MKKTNGILLCGCLGVIAACTEASDPDLSVNPDLSDLKGNDFQCTGNWPTDWNPCHYPWDSQPATHASLDETGVVTLVLHRTPIAIDGGGSTVYIDLLSRRPTAREVTVSATGNAHLIESSDAISVAIDPAALSLSGEARNAGRFKVDFEWGSIAGTYDTDANTDIE